MTGSGLRSLAWPAAFTLTLALSACSVPVTQTRPPAAPVAEPQGQPSPSEVEPAAPSPGTVKPTAPASPWQRLREGFVMPGCDYEPAVLREARRFTRSPDRFASNWREAMPFLLFVLDDIERRQLPTEFALLPYVESRYRPRAAQGQGPAGIWQLMPRTASARGLVVSRSLDERLDVLASTRVALDLLERYDRELGDWRLATMAYNAGEYRIKAQLPASVGPGLAADALAKLKLSPITHQHLARLLALACIIREPDRFQVSLPEIADDDALEVLALPTPVDLRLAAALSGLTPGQLRSLNTAADPSSTNAVLKNRLLLPAARVAGFEAGLRRIPQQSRAYWKMMQLDGPMQLGELAIRVGIGADVLAAANRLTDSAELEPGQNILVPTDRPETQTGESSEVHVVRPGDTLSAIASRYGVRLAQLLRWNAIDRESTLRIGMRLRVHAPGY
jgi:membrane-bound lytic murein transglycosylase D